MNERPQQPFVLEIEDMKDLNPLILGLASMLVQRLIAKAKAAAAHQPPTTSS